MLLDNVILKKEKCISTPKGDVKHVLKDCSEGFSGFGEAYLTTIGKGMTKGWKKHLKMTSNLYVVTGSILIRLVEEQEGNFFSSKDFLLSESKKERLVVPPGLWMAFGGKEKKNIMLNIANQKHDKEEALNIPLEDFKLNKFPEDF